jgi:hypothetical protein
MKKKKVALGISIAIFVAFGTAIAWNYFKPPDQSDPLCTFVRSHKFDCVALVTDAATYRPGGIAAVGSDPNDKKADLPSSYLDTEGCIVKGASVAAWSTSSNPFNLSTVTYGRTAIASLGGHLANGVKVDVGPTSNRIESVKLSFGPAHTALLDERILEDRIGSCAVTIKCVAFIKGGKYKVIKRILSSDSLAYTFSDSKGASVRIAELEKGSLSASGTFTVTGQNGEELQSQSPSALGVQFISDDVIRTVQVCESPAAYRAQGTASLTAGGDGGVGLPTLTATQGVSGASAVLEGSGNEPRGGQHGIPSAVRAMARVDPIGTNELRFVSNIDVRGGQYGAPTALGLAPALRVTKAHITAELQGEVEVLARKDGGTLQVSWSDMPPSGGDPSRKAGAEFVVLDPDSTVTSQSAMSGTGSVRIPIRNEGKYTVRPKLSVWIESQDLKGLSFETMSRMSVKVEFGDSPEGGPPGVPRERLANVADKRPSAAEQPPTVVPTKATPETSPSRAPALQPACQAAPAAFEMIELERGKTLGFNASGTKTGVFRIPDSARSGTFSIWWSGPAIITPMMEVSISHCARDFTNLMNPCGESAPAFRGSNLNWGDSSGSSPTCPITAPAFVSFRLVRAPGEAYDCKSDCDLKVYWAR